MGTSIECFVTDPSFLDHNTAFVSVLDNAGVGTLTQHGLSYFVDAYVAKDARPATSRVVDWVASYQPTLLIDENFYAGFITQFEALPQATRDAVFQIVDRLLFNGANTGNEETWLTSTDTVKDLYVPNSLIKPTSSVSGTVYVGTDYTPQTITTIPFITFTLNIPTGSTTTAYDFTVFCDNNTWLQRYSNCKIVGVSPPLSYADLLNLPLSTTNANKLLTASSTVGLNYNTLAPQIAASAASGYELYKVTVNDTANNTTVLAPFIILYKGAEPTQLEMRQAVLAAVLSSGVGNQASWLARIPELFVDIQFYMIPMFDNATPSSDGTIYPSVINTWKVFQNVEKVLTGVDTSYLQKNTELLSANYEKLLLACVMDPNSKTLTPDQTTIMGTFPTYQSWSSTDSNFQYMSPEAQQFALSLSEALTVATGNGTSTSMFAVNDRSLQYVAFVVGAAEFCVITKTCYDQLLSETD